MKRPRVRGRFAPDRRKSTPILRIRLRLARAYPCRLVARLCERTRSAACAVEESATDVRSSSVPPAWHGLPAHDHGQDARATVVDGAFRGAVRGRVGTDEAALCASPSVAPLSRARRERESWGCPGQQPMSLPDNGLEDIRLFLGFRIDFAQDLHAINVLICWGSSSVNDGRAATMV